LNRFGAEAKRFTVAEIGHKSIHNFRIAATRRKSGVKQAIAVQTK